MSLPSLRGWRPVKIRLHRAVRPRFCVTTTPKPHGPPHVPAVPRSLSRTTSLAVLQTGQAGNRAELAAVEVVEGLVDLRLAVHDEGAAHGDGLADRLAAEGQHDRGQVAIAGRALHQGQTAWSDPAGRGRRWRPGRPAR